MPAVPGVLAADSPAEHTGARVGDYVEKGECSLIAGVQPQAFAHPWKPRERRQKG